MNIDKITMKYFLLALWSAGTGDKCIGRKVVVYPMVRGRGAEEPCREGSVTRCTLTLILTLLLLQGSFVAGGSLHISTCQRYTHVQPQTA